MGPPLPPPSQHHEVQDMEIDEDEEEVREPAQPEQNQVPGEGDHIDGALDSFYADLAEIDGNSQDNNDVTMTSQQQRNDDVTKAPPSGDSVKPPSVYQSAA